jgi:hypothetical protein
MPGIPRLVQFLRRQDAAAPQRCRDKYDIVGTRHAVSLQKNRNIGKPSVRTVKKEISIFHGRFS